MRCCGVRPPRRVGAAARIISWPQMRCRSHRSTQSWGCWLSAVGNSEHKAGARRQQPWGQTEQTDITSRHVTHMLDWGMKHRTDVWACSPELHSTAPLMMMVTRHQPAASSLKSFRSAQPTVSSACLGLLTTKPAAATAPGGSADRNCRLHSWHGHTHQ